MLSNGEQKTKYSFSTPAILPDGNGGFTPCPDLLTEDEAVRFLRLDEVGIEDPAGTLRYYRKKGLLKATQVGKCIRYRRVELENFLKKIQDKPEMLLAKISAYIYYIDYLSTMKSNTGSFRHKKKGSDK